MPFIRVVVSAVGMAIGVWLITYALRWIARGLSQLILGAVLASVGGLFIVVGLGYLLDEFEQNKDLAKARKSAQRRVEGMQRRAAHIFSR